MTTTDSIAFREVSDGEAAFFRENGWVKLEGFVPAEVVAMVLERIQAKMGSDGRTAFFPGANRGRRGIEPNWSQFHEPWRDKETGEIGDELLYGLTHSAHLGEACVRLAGYRFRYFTDKIAVKMPKGSDGSGPTAWHLDVGQRGSEVSGHGPYGANDSPLAPPDGQQQMQFWIALAPVAPEQGAMRFISSNKVTDEVWTVIDSMEVADSYARFEERGIISPPLRYEAGDATVHASNTLHSTLGNSTDTARWGHIISVFPADSVFTGQHIYVTEEASGLEPGKTFPTDSFPVL